MKFQVASGELFSGGGARKENQVFFADISAQTFQIYKIRFASCCYGFEDKFEYSCVEFYADTAEI